MWFETLQLNLLQDGSRVDFLISGVRSPSTVSRRVDTSKILQGFQLLRSMSSNCLVFPFLHSEPTHRPTRIPYSFVYTTSTGSPLLRSGGSTSRMSPDPQSPFTPIPSSLTRTKPFTSNNYVGTRQICLHRFLSTSYH